MTWEEFYKDRLNKDYFNHIKTRYQPFIKEIENVLNKNSTVLEVGCGIGSITKALRERNKARFKLSDKSLAMLKLSKRNTNLNGFQFDILNESPKRVDLIHSHGVLEHFDITEIRKIIKNQLLKANILIHYVPSNKYKYKSFGDERLWSKEQWFKICKPDQIIEFNNGHDLILKWRSK